MSCFQSYSNKRFTVIAVLSVVFMAPAVLGAFPFGRSEKSGLNELKQGDAAVSLGDTALAEKYYSKAKALSKDNRSLWSECVSRLGTLFLLKNDIISAKKLLAEFRERMPADSAGTLPGEIMVAENNFAGAEKFFRQLIENNDVWVDKAKFCLADILMKQQKYQQAYDMFASLRTSRTALISLRSEYAMALALMQMNRFTEARTMLDKLLDSRNDLNFKKLRLLCAVKEGDLEYFRKNYILKEEDIHADSFMCYLLELAAEAAIRKSDHAWAAALYEDAFKFAPARDKKRDIIGKLFSCCAAYDIDGAAKVAERYSVLFPEASDRVLLLMQAGRLLASGGKPQEAVKFYAKVSGDKENLLVERYAAASEGASAAEQGNLYQDADRFYQLLLTLAQSSGRRDDVQLSYAGFLLRRQEYAKADEVLKSIIKSDVLTPAGEQAAHLYLQSKSLQNKLSKDELPLAQQLCKSKNRKHFEFASFTEAEIFRIAGEENSLVRRKYLDFITTFPESKFVPNARFQAARLAGRDGNYIASAEEFIAFAGQFPDHNNAGAAQFIAIDNFCRANLIDKAESVLAKLGNNDRYPEAYISGILKFGSHLFNSGDCKKALEVVQKYTSLENWKNLGGRADILYLEARILAKLKEYDKAVKKLDELISVHPDSPEFCEANFLAGNIRCDVFNDFAGAEKNFEQAMNRSAAGVFRHVASGRLADCRYAMYLQSNEAKLLESADELYRDIAENAVHPDMQLQAAYKAGLCREVSGDREKAVEDYEQVLYSALVLKNSGITPVQSWCDRAAYSAIELALTDDEAEDTTKAQQLLSIYRKLGFANSTRDFQMLRRKIVERQKFLNRGARP